MHAARGLMIWVSETFKPVSWHVEYPMSQVLESGQVVREFIDLLLETNDGWIIIDHKATPRPRSDWQEIARGYSGQLASYKSAVESVSGQPVVATWINFPVGGGVVKIEHG